MNKLNNWQFWAPYSAQVQLQYPKRLYRHIQRYVFTREDKRNQGKLRATSLGRLHACQLFLQHSQDVS